MSEDLRGMAYKIWQKCNDWKTKVEANGQVFDAQQRAEMASWSQVPQLFEPYAQLPDPDGPVKTIIDDLKGALTELSDGQLLPPNKANGEGETILPIGDLKHMNVTSLVDGWTGSAAQNFNTNFVVPFPAKVQSQFVAVYVMRSALQAYQSVWKNARHDVEEIAKKTLKALEHDCHFGFGGDAMAYTILGSVASVATVFAGGGVIGGVLLLEVIAGAAQVGAQAAGGDKPKVDISGSDPLYIVPKLRKALDDLKKYINEEQDKVYAVLSRDLAQLNAHRDQLVPRKPELAGANRGNIHGFMGNAN